MDAKSEIREFLTSRRGRITPEQAGVASYGPRRVPGLRREEVAVLAGVSATYYTRLERGDMHGVSDSVLDALARALRLDDAERAHLFDLARAAQPRVTPPRRRAAKQPIRPSVQHVLDAMTGAPAFVRNGRLDIQADRRRSAHGGGGRDGRDRRRRGPLDRGRPRRGGARRARDGETARAGDDARLRGMPGSGKPAELLREAGIDASAIADAARSVVGGPATAADAGR